MKNYKYYALTEYSSFLPRVIRMDENYNITIYDVKTSTWEPAPDDISLPAMIIGKVEADEITEEQANIFIARWHAVREENLKSSKPERKPTTVQISPQRVRTTKPRPERVKQYMEISSKTKVFAQDGPFYLLTNEQDWDYETVDHRKITACRIDTRYKEITKEVPLSEFTNHDPYWMKPERQFTTEELEKVKHYEKI